jgi:type II secretory pathway pseudopilin PulG
MSVVEALILLGLLILIALVGIPSAIQNVQKSRAARCAEQLDLIARGAAKYAAGNGRFPDQIGDLIPAYLEAMPVCPSGGAYTLNSPDTSPPTCTIPGHVL